ncbi:hypothetical protein Poly51_16690 [Rubripirellula tenax]|uniref:DUF1579 domain-containing protein n=1 Tax=Rubripirellula tenax TaxID=2528015 RepID=A0A5C6FGU8_9BACT|nr:DUF1579 domain-containing protein [Rubripirellula tenax]TWU58889.1 hypothetical protein Poly51_16690 [Rubripirellula tenax]
MKNLVCAIAAWVAFCFSPIQAQEPELPGAQKEHELLGRFVGEWTSTSKIVASDEQPSMECSGSMRSKMLGEFWVINEMSGDMGGAEFKAIQTIGFDASKEKYVGTWVDSMMNHLWHYEGRVDATGKKLVLLAEGPNFMAEGKLTTFRDSYEFVNADTFITTSEMMGDDGKWLTFMTAEATRNAATKSAD